jgi:hypothetical protein
MPLMTIPALAPGLSGWPAAVLAGLAVLLWPRWRDAGGWLLAPTPARHPPQLGPWRPRRGPVTPGAVEVSACLELLALALDSGCGVTDAVDLVARGTPGAAGAELATVAAAVHWGLPWAQAWSLASPGWAPARMALALAHEAGVGPAGPVARAATDLRERHAQELELAAARLGVRIVLPLGLAYLPAFVLLAVVPLVVVLAGGLWP